MKKNFYKTNTVLTVFLFLMYSFVPVCSMIAGSLGYELVLNNSITWAATTLSVSAIITIFMFIFTGKKVYKLGGVCACLSILMTELNWLYYGFINTTAMVIVALCFIFGVMVWVRFAWPMAMKVTCAFIAVFSLLLLSFFSTMAFIFDADVTTVMQHVESPDGTAWFDLINEDKAEGTKYTTVNVYEKNADIDLGVLRFEKNPKKVYDKKDIEFEKVEVSWNDNTSLIINGEIYSIK